MSSAGALGELYVFHRFSSLRLTVSLSACPNDESGGASKQGDGKDDGCYKCGKKGHWASGK